MIAIDRFPIYMIVEGSRMEFAYTSSKKLQNSWNAVLARAQQNLLRKRYTRKATPQGVVSTRFNNLTHLYKYNPLPEGLFYSAKNKCFVYRPRETNVWVEHTQNLRTVLKRYDRSAHWVNGTKIPPSLRNPQQLALVAWMKESGLVA